MVNLLQCRVEVSQDSSHCKTESQDVGCVHSVGWFTKFIGDVVKCREHPGVRQAEMDGGVSEDAIIAAQMEEQLLVIEHRLEDGADRIEI